MVTAQEAKKKEVSHTSDLLDEIIVTSNRSNLTLFEQIEPADKLTNEQLLLRMEPTIGETLNRLPGVSSTYFAPGASRPILRGLGDDRVRMLQNGISIMDVANVSPDHAISVDPLSIDSVEVVRGPATMLYGPNTLGGVVNLMDQKIAEKPFKGDLPTGSFGVMGGTADKSLSESAEINWGTGPWVFHLDLFHREAGNIDIPNYARSAAQRAIDDPMDPQPRNVLPNSFANSEGLGVGASHIFASGFLGFSFSGMNSDYGTVGEPDVTIDLSQRRWDVRGAVYEAADFLREIRFSLGHSNYTHTEFEGVDVGTLFDVEGLNGRIEFLKKEILGFEGTIGYEVELSEFSAEGDEAFLPSIETAKNSVFLLEEKKLGNTRVQIGARYDHHSNERIASVDFGPGLDIDFGTVSTSAGLIYRLHQDYAISLFTAFTQRPPTFVELFADGVHAATGTFEQGDANLGKEQAYSIDLSIRKKSGRVTGSAGVFFYHFNDFVNLNNTGLLDPVDNLPIFNYRAIDADFYGFEFESAFHLLDPIPAGGVDDDASRIPGNHKRCDVILRADYVHATDQTSNTPLPRIAPFRIGTTIEYGSGPLMTFIEGQFVAEQDRVADFELPTDQYFLINAGVSYRTKMAGVDSTLFLRGVNLTNEEARLSTSFLKDVAPLAGRGIVAGFKTQF